MIDKMSLKYYALEGTYIITMKTRENRTLYISMWDGKPTWTFNKSYACVWPDPELCRKFANDWFKNFKGYTIREYCSMEEV